MRLSKKTTTFYALIILILMAPRQGVFAEGFADSGPSTFINANNWIQKDSATAKSLGILVTVSNPSAKSINIVVTKGTTQKNLKAFKTYKVKVSTQNPPFSTASVRVIIPFTGANKTDISYKACYGKLCTWADFKSTSSSVKDFSAGLDSKGNIVVEKVGTDRWSWQNQGDVALANYSHDWQIKNFNEKIDGLHEWSSTSILQEEDVVYEDSGIYLNDQTFLYVAEFVSAIPKGFPNVIMALGTIENNKFIEAVSSCKTVHVDPGGEGYILLPGMPPSMISGDAFSIACFSQDQPSIEKFRAGNLVVKVTSKNAKFQNKDVVNYFQVQLDDAILG
jgi:hypothetical protein